ncbi:MAG: DUF1840 domain-containing protein [Polaromonas sp.]
MLYKFKSKNAGDVIMLDATGRQMLEIIGKDAGRTGIILVDQMPAAITAIEAAVASEEQDARQATAQGVTPATDEPALRQRAVPFIDLLRHCHQDANDITWGV